MMYLKFLKLFLAIFKIVGKSRSYITNSLRLLTLPEEVKNLILNNLLSPGHAKILVGLDNSLLLANKIVKKKLSVRQAENLVKILKNNHKNDKILKDANILSTESILSEKIGMRVSLNNKKNNSGTITFEYKGLDQLDRLISIVKMHY